MAYIFWVEITLGVKDTSIVMLAFLSWLFYFSFHSRPIGIINGTTSDTDVLVACGVLMMVEVAGSLFVSSSCLLIATSRFLSCKRINVVNEEDSLSIYEAFLNSSSDSSKPFLYIRVQKELQHVWLMLLFCWPTYYGTQIHFVV